MCANQLESVLVEARESAEKVRSRLASLFAVGGVGIPPKRRVEIACQFIIGVETLVQELRDATSDARERMEAFASGKNIPIEGACA